MTPSIISMAAGVMAWAVMRSTVSPHLPVDRK